MADRAFVLGRLQRELRAAEGVHEDRYAAELRQEMARLSAGTPDNPVRETAAARPPAKRVSGERALRSRLGRSRR